MNSFTTTNRVSPLSSLRPSSPLDFSLLALSPLCLDVSCLMLVHNYYPLLPPYPSSLTLSFRITHIGPRKSTQATEQHRGPTRGPGATRRRPRRWGLLKSRTACAPPEPPCLLPTAQTVESSPPVVSPKQQQSKDSPEERISILFPWERRFWTDRPTFGLGARWRKEHGPLL